MNISESIKPLVIFVLGRPGAGKGTVSKSIQEEFGFLHLSVGQVLRDERKNQDSPYKASIDEHFRDGLMIPAEITYDLLDKIILNSKLNRFVLDGFPGDMDSLEYWKKNDLSQKMELRFVLFVDCPEEICSQRILARGAAGSGRDDDAASKLKTRFQLFERVSLPVIQYFENICMVNKVDSSGTKEETYSQVKPFFNNIL
ncbi:hypothetical protein L9F63_009219 [Diploptera punctata]|uniref:Uncharacterized protein n=1 Tax=Diploptera punctata TaxID=6984 RepID=A0AAD8ESH3_DIPPU|nr:hypothetical protein L9F63_009219 [Diploptera punctata]